MRRSASEIIRNLEIRVSNLEKQATTKTEAYDALRRFMAKNKTNTRLLIELSGYLNILKRGGDLTDRDLKNIRRALNQNYGEDIAYLFRFQLTGENPIRPVNPPKAPASSEQRFPKTLLLAKKLVKDVRKHFGPRMITVPKRGQKVIELYIDARNPNRKFFSIPFMLKGESKPLIQVIAPLDGDYSQRKMPTLKNLFWRGKTTGISVDAYVEQYKRHNSYFEKPKTGPKAPTIKEIIRFLENEARTDIGGGFDSLHMYRGSSSYWEFQMEPGDRQRQDHWHFSMDDYDHEEDNRDYAWSDWESNWAYPLQEQTTQALRVKFPILADNRQWGVMVGEKGHIDFQFPKDIIPEN